MAVLEAWLRAAERILWGPGTLALLLGTGAFLTVRLDFLPWRNLGWALRSVLSREARRGGEGGVSPFSALMTALAATIGTGNIVGVATALTAGGPGALVWMEISALLGMSTKFAECTLAVKYRRRDRQGQPYGGPMYVMATALGRPGAVLGAVFALFAVGASFGIGSMTQANSIVEALSASFSLPPLAVGAVTAGLALVIILGGIQGISRVSSVLVPAMALLYLGAGLAVILGNWRNLPQAVGDILLCALSPRAAAGGAAGTAAASFFNTLRWGVARGVFSNEAGLGSAAISAASARTDSPARQGYISMTGIVFDTLVLCTVTGLAICASGVLDGAEAQGADGAALTILAFQSVLGQTGGALVSICVTLFAFTTIIGWAYQGEMAFGYLTGGRWLYTYRSAFALAALWGAVVKLETVFRLADICNALMALPNLLCLLLLSGVAAAEARTFQVRLQGAPPSSLRGIPLSRKRKNTAKS